jgi:CP family cyanate transporter-like MFS transporter
LAGELQVDFATVGILSGLPVFCYAIFMPIATFVVSKLDLDKSTLICMVICGVGIIVRSLGGFEMLFAGTIIIGSGIALGNVVFPLLISRDFTNHYVSVIGVVSIGMNIANFAAGALTYPITEMVGWRLALGAWFIFVLVTLYLIFHYQIRKKRGASRKAIRQGMSEWISTRAVTGTDDLANLESRPVYKTGITYLLAAIFLLQCATWNVMTAWLPQIFVTLGQDPSSAGVAAGIFQLFGIGGAIATAPLLDKAGYLTTYVVVSLGWLVLPLGLIFLPQLWILHVVIAGFAQSMIYNSIFGAINHWSKTPREIRQMSAVVQTSAYAFAGFTPMLSGWIYDMTDDWNVILWISVGMLTLMLILAIITAVRYLSFSIRPDQPLKRERAKARFIQAGNSIKRISNKVVRKQR